MKRNDNRRTLLIILMITVGLCGLVPFMNKRKAEETIHHVTGTIVDKTEESVIIKSEDDKLIEFDKDEIDEKLGTEVDINYKKEENKNNSEASSTKPSTPSNSSSGTNPTPTKPATPSTSVTPPIVNTPTKENNEVIDYTVVEPSKIPSSWLDGGIYSAHYTAAYKKLQEMSLDEKIGQVLIARYPEANALGLLSNNHLGGYVFYERDFKGKTKNQVIDMINSVQKSSKIPLLTAIDEEGGAVSRLSSNTNLTSTPFLSPRDLYTQGGFEAITNDTRNKSIVLKNLGLNLNFAPVVDVSTNPSDYIYKRTLGEDTELTGLYASTVIKASKGLGVSYTLKHFPGYGSNKDTHTGGSTSTKSYADILASDIPPFKKGIEAGAEAVMVSHNIVAAIDSSNESSISLKMHQILRNDLHFTGIIVTDDISMGAMKNVQNIGGKAISAGNDLIITSDPATTFSQIKTSIENKSVNMDTLDHAVFRLLAWKYYKGLLK